MQVIVKICIIEFIIAAVMNLIWGFGIPNNVLTARKKNYEVTLDSVENMPMDNDETLIDFSNVSVIKRERFLNGTFMVYRDLDNNYEVSMNLYNSMNMDGKWMPMVMGVRNLKICEGLPGHYAKFAQPTFKPGEKSNMPKVDADNSVCPFPAGEYWLNEIELETRPWPNYLPSGLIKAEIIVTKDKKPLAGVRLICKIDYIA